MGNYHIRFGGEGSETWHGNVLRRTALTPLWGESTGGVPPLVARGAAPPWVSEEIVSASERIGDTRAVLWMSEN